MNENVRKVFDMLRVEPNEELYIQYNNKSKSDFKRRINECLVIEKFEPSLNTWVGDFTIGIRQFIVGEIGIIKMPKFTKLEQKAIELYRELGYEWIAKDKNSAEVERIYAYKKKPRKGTYRGCANVWETFGGDDMLLPNELNFNSLHWEDTEPYYIGD